MAPPTTSWRKYNSSEEPPPALEELSSADARTAQRAAYTTDRAVRCREVLAQCEHERRRQYLQELQRKREERQAEELRQARIAVERRQRDEQRMKAYHRSILPAAAPHV